MMNDNKIGGESMLAAFSYIRDGMVSEKRNNYQNDPKTYLAYWNR